MNTVDKLKNSFLVKKSDAFLHRRFSGNTMDYKRIFSMYLPLLFDQTFLIWLSFLNLSMISSSGDAAVAAVDMVDSINIFFVGALIAIASGGTVVIAQYKGSKDTVQIPKAVGATVFAVLFLGAAVSAVLLIFHMPILSFLFGAAEPAVMENAQVYMVGATLSFCGISITSAASGALRGIGETRSSLLISVLQNGLYVILNYVFITRMNMGILGMCLSLNICRYTAAFVAIILLLKSKSNLFSNVRDLFKINFKLIKRILIFGLPFAYEQLFFNGGKILTQTFIVGMGEAAQVINAVCLRLNSIGTIAQSSLSLLSITVVGQCLGNKDIPQAKKMVKSTLGAVFLISVVTTFGLYLIFNPLVGSLTTNKEIVPEILKILMMSQIGQVFTWGASWLLPAVLRTGGDARYTSFVSLLSMWLFRVGAGYIFGVTLGLGIMGVWMATIVDWIIRGTFFSLRYRSNKWYLHKVID